MKKYYVSNIEIPDCLNGRIEDELNDRAADGYKLVHIIGPNSATFKHCETITAYQLIFEKDE